MHTPSEVPERQRKLSTFLKKAIEYMAGQGQVRIDNGVVKPLTWS